MSSLSRQSKRSVFLSRTSLVSGTRKDTAGQIWTEPHSTVRYPNSHKPNPQRSPEGKPANKFVIDRGINGKSASAGKNVSQRYCLDACRICVLNSDLSRGAAAAAVFLPIPHAWETSLYRPSRRIPTNNDNHYSASWKMDPPPGSNPSLANALNHWLPMV
ncbi:hypothetical protein J6590_013262 [Homalodisca vitripennis]|nr:hypothetical protein J6590_013262 [Homalodisca vitripennis]